MKVVFRYDAGPALRRELATLKEQGIDVVLCPEGPDEPFLSEMRDADALWHILQPVTAETIAAAPKLKLIQKIGVGVNTIDLEAAQRRGVAVCNMPGTNSRAVAEMTLLLMLAVLRRLPRMDRLVEGGGWAVQARETEVFGEIAGRKVGFVGFGAGPALLAPILTLMGADVLYTARAPKDVPYRHMPLDRLVEEVDILSLHVPLTAETDKFLNADRIARMKPGAVLVNTARGGLVDEAALCAALKSGHLLGAGLDVLAAEPVDPANPLINLDNVVKAPHVAWLTNETFARSLEVAVHNSWATTGAVLFRHRVV